MGFNKPYLLFGGTGAPMGGALDLLGAHYTLDEIDAALAALRPMWWQVVALLDAGPAIVKSNENDAKAKKNENEKAEHLRQLT